MSLLRFAQWLSQHKLAPINPCVIRRVSAAVNPLTQPQDRLGRCHCDGDTCVLANRVRSPALAIKVDYCRPPCHNAYWDTCIDGMQLSVPLVPLRRIDPVRDHPNAETASSIAPDCNVSIPFTSGPPLLPGFVAASVCMRFSRSVMPLPRFFALTIPAVTVLSNLSGCPSATTQPPSYRYRQSTRPRD